METAAVVGGSADAATKAVAFIGCAGICCK